MTTSLQMTTEMKKMNKIQVPFILNVVFDENWKHISDVVENFHSELAKMLDEHGCNISCVHDISLIKTDYYQSVECNCCQCSIKRMKQERG